jgi:hypothetical protein
MKVFYRDQTLTISPAYLTPGLPSDAPVYPKEHCLIGGPHEHEV